MDYESVNEEFESDLDSDSDHSSIVLGTGQMLPYQFEPSTSESENDTSEDDETKEVRTENLDWLVIFSLELRLQFENFYISSLKFSTKYLFIVSLKHMSITLIVNL